MPIRPPCRPVCLMASQDYFENKAMWRDSTCSPLLYDSGSSRGALLGDSWPEFLSSEGLEHAKKLCGAGVTCGVKVYEGLLHGRHFEQMQGACF